MENTSHDNVKFDIYSTSHDATVGMEVLSDTPTFTAITGHLQEFYFTQEATIEGVHERDRATRFRLIVKSSKQIDEYLKLGSYIRITRRRHPDTLSWYLVSGTEQYIVSYINESHSAGRFKSIGLRRKDYGQ